MKLLIGFVVGLCVGLFLYHNVIMQRVINNRAMDHGLMQYSAKEDKFVFKDEFWELKYVRDGL